MGPRLGAVYTYSWVLYLAHGIFSGGWSPLEEAHRWLIGGTYSATSSLMVSTRFLPLDGHKARALITRICIPLSFLFALCNAQILLLSRGWMYWPLSILTDLYPSLRPWVSFLHITRNGTRLGAIAYSVVNCLSFLTRVILLISNRDYTRFWRRRLLLIYGLS